ncbi:N-6 DNA methylase [bacterium]|nr:N-6 DNA methylase [bacterium]
MPKLIEDIIKEHSKVMSNQFKEIADWSDSEEDLRVETAKIIEEFRKTAKIEHLRLHNEVTIGKGKADAVYNYIIIEYKKPGRLTTRNDSPGNREVIGQLKQRFGDLEKEENRKIEKLFGVGFDGYKFIFIRYRNQKWEVDNPIPVTPYTTERFLRALLALAVKGKAFQPDYLTGDFGSQSQLSQQGIYTFYKAITHTDNMKAKTLFKQWKLLFGEVGGYDVKNLNNKIKELGKFYNIPGKPSPPDLLFSVHTYYALFIKLLAAEIMHHFSGFSTSYLKKLREAHSSEKLREELIELEKGGIYGQFGLKNFLEGDLFLWYLDAWDTKDAQGKDIEIQGVVRGIVKCLNQYDPCTLSIEPEKSRDLLKDLYQNLFPGDLRHSLGEYYTPDWLAEYVIQEVGYDGDPDKRVLDPACGSGTFLTLCINKIREYAYQNIISDEDLLKKTITNVIGFDLNPLAVLAARLNYIISIRDLIKYGGDIEIPVYLCDSIMTPSEHGGLFKDTRQLKIAALTIPLEIPVEVTENRDIIAKYTTEIEKSLDVDNEAEIFIERCKIEGIIIEDEGMHVALYNNLLDLKKKGRNGVWARIIKNAFAPLFIDKVDYVVGNPPWVNWESLPDEYRNSMKPLWVDYGLFSLSADKGRHGGGKKDISMIFTYTAADNFLKQNGKLGFVITQSVFKTEGAGDGFRNFKFKDKEETKIYLEPIHVSDMSDFQPFEGATNRTATLVVKKTKEKFYYPVDYSLWKKIKRGRIKSEYELNEVINRMNINNLAAEPVDSEKITSPWLTATKEALPGIRKVIGNSFYTAHEGVNSGGLNGGYWIEVIKILSNRDILIRNLYDVGRKEVPLIETVIESNYVLPLLRGRDVSRWIGKPSCKIIMVQDPLSGIGIAEDVLSTETPKTYGYFKKLEQQLRERALFKKYHHSNAPFYSMYNVGEYTMAAWKVVWKDMGDYVAPAVISRNEFGLILPEHHVMFVSFDEPKEAHFIAAMLGSSPACLTSWAYTTSYGKSTHLMEHIAIPKFNPSIEAHLKLAELSEKCHEAAKAGDDEAIKEYEAEIDKLAAKIWGITDEELKAIQEVVKK